MMLNIGLGAFVQQEGRGAYTGSATQSDWDKFDAYVASEVAALRALGMDASAVTYHPTVEGGTGPHHAGDSAASGEGAAYWWEITIDPVKFPGYSRPEYLERYRDYAGGDPARAAQGAINAATAQAQSVYIPPPEAIPVTSQPTYTSTPAHIVTPSTAQTPNTAQTPATPNVIDSIINTVKGSDLVSSTSLASIPTWAWLAGGAAALYFFMGRGK
jgi:hypothetical protein